jgi:hypothetical protein
MEWIVVMRGVSFEGVRAVRRRVAGEAAARERAVSAPIDEGEGPVIRTGRV